jgi:hypothetical protein
MGNADLWLRFHQLRKFMPNNPLLVIGAEGTDRLSRAMNQV